MKARYTILLSFALIFSACSTTYYSSAPLEDDIYYSSSDASMRNVVIEDTDVKYNSPKYKAKRYNQVKEYDGDTEQEALSKEKAVIEYSGDYIINDTIPADTVIYVEDDEATKRIVKIYLPGVSLGYMDTFHDGYYYHLDPFYYPRSSFSFGFNWGWGSFFYSPFDLGYNWRFGHRYWDPFYNNYYGYHPYYWNHHYGYNPYNYWGHGYGYGYGHSYGYAYGNSYNGKNRTYQHRKNRGRNFISNNQGQRTSRSQSTLNRRTLTTGGSTGSATLRPDRRSTIENSTTRSTLNNTRSRSRLDVTKGKNIRLAEESALSQGGSRSGRSVKGTNTRSRYVAGKTYSKPKSYNTQNNRRPTRSGEYRRTSPSNRSSINSGQTVRRVVSSPSKSRSVVRSSSKGSSNRSYSKPVQTRSNRSVTRSSNSSYKRSNSVSKSSSTRSVSRSSSSSSRSSGSVSRSSSSSSRSSGSSSRSSSGGRGRR